MNDLTRILATLARVSVLPVAFGLAACSGAVDAAPSNLDGGRSDLAADSGSALPIVVTGGNSGNGSPTTGNSGNGNSGSGNSGSGNSGSGSSGNGNSVDDGGASHGGGASEVSLVVSSATVEATVDSFPPASGNFFLVVGLTLKNLGASEPLPMSTLYFALQTSQSLLVTPSPEQAAAQCSDTISVASGGQDTCTLAFEVPEGQTPTALVYDDDQGDTVTAKVPPSEGPSVACGTYAGWVSSDPSSACLDCLGGTTGASDAGTPACEAAAKAYASSCSSCASKCSPLNGSSDPYCTCEIGCDDSACQSLFQSWMSCQTSTCEVACP